MTSTSSFPRCAKGATVRDACVGMVDDLHSRWELPSVYLLIDGRMRCQASRGYFHVSDGFTTAAGVIGRVVSTGRTEVLDNASDDPTFIAAIPGLKAEVCVPVRVNGVVVGAVNLESRAGIEVGLVEEAEAAALFLGQRISGLGGLGTPSLSERLARVAIGIARQTEAWEVQVSAVEGAQTLSGMSSAGLARLLPTGWAVTCATGPLASLMRSWDVDSLAVLGGWVWAGTSSYFPDNEDIPEEYAFLGKALHALSVQPLVVAGEVTGVLMTADTRPVGHDPALTSALELLASQTAATLAMATTVQHLAHQANHDSLTGLSNRRALVDALELDLAAGARSALVLIDLDGFKSVNDQHGHGAGDALLAAVGRRLAACARQRDLVCRLGGDEFAVLLRDISSETYATAVAERFLQATTAGGEGGWHASVGASAGIRLVSGDSPSSVLNDADTAMYAAKHAGRGQLVLWNPELRQDELDAIALVTDLRAAMRADLLTMAYQPVADIDTLQVRGLEALARWHHPDRGHVSPAVFVAAAERHGAVAELTRWVLARALRDARWWDRELNLAINISAAQLADESVVADVQAALEAAQFPANRIVLEVTETFAVQDMLRAKRTLQQLHDLGVKLSLDDFGTGYSSLTHAQELPFDILKIDRSFVAAAAAGDQGALATISAVCALAARLRVDVVAEGVEDQARLPELRELGCGYAQGYALARPMPREQVDTALSSGHAWFLTSGSVTSS